MRFHLARGGQVGVGVGPPLDVEIIVPASQTSARQNFFP
jgi:hypothetical protein